MSWYDFDENAVVDCRCGWSGPASAGGIEIFSQCFSFECPECGRTLAVFSHPTIDETKRKAAEGNEKAKAELASTLKRETFLERAAASELKDPGELPDLKGDELVIEWDFDDPPEDHQDCWTVLRHDGKEFWREVAYYEGIDRFREVASILREKYGTRLVELRPTSKSDTYLCGDDLYAGDTIKRINENLRRLHEEGRDSTS